MPLYPSASASHAGSKSGSTSRVGSRPDSRLGKNATSLGALERGDSDRKDEGVEVEDEKSGSGEETRTQTRRSSMVKEL